MVILDKMLNLTGCEIQHAVELSVSGASRINCVIRHFT